MNTKIEIKGVLASHDSQETRGGHTLHKLLIEVAGYNGKPSSFYPVNAWNGDFDSALYSTGDLVTVEAYINSREWNEKHYLEAKLASISNHAAAKPANNEYEDDVPF